MFPWLAWGLLLASPAFMASNVIIGRASVDTMPPIALAFWRWLTAVLILLPLVAGGLKRHRAALLAGWRRLLLLGGLGMGVCGAFVYIGLETTTATNAGLIYAISPVAMIVLGAVFRGERITGLQVAGILAAILGVVVILTRGHPEALLALRFTVGDLWILAAGLGWAVYTVTLRHSFKGVPTLPLFTAIAAAGTLLLLPATVVEGLAGAPVVLTPAAVASVIGVAVFASILALGSYQKAVDMVGSAKAGPFMYLMPIYGAGLAVLFLGETIAWFHVAGVALILPGVAVATLSKPAPAVDPTP